MTKGSGSDSLYIDDNGVNANVLLEGTSNISYSSNGTDLTINTSYGSGKKSVNDKITIKNGLSELDNVSVLGTDLESVLKSNIISISGIYNKKGKSYSFTGTKYDDTVNGTNKKDFIEVFDGNNTINVGKKGSSTIEAGVGNDTYNIKNLTSKVTIHDKAGDDVLNLSGNKYSDLNFFFNVLKNDEIIDINSNNTNLLVKDLYILDKKTITSMSKSKSVNPNKGVLIEEFFFADEENETDGAIETINVKDKGNVSELLNSSVTAITNAVKSCLNKTSYNSAYELIEKGTTSEKKELIACYVSNKNSGNELLLGHNISLLNSEIAGWKSSAPDIAPLVTDNNDRTVDIPIIIQENIR